MRDAVQTKNEKGKGPISSMNRKTGAVAVLFLLLLLPLGQVNANSGGRFNSANGCGCHGGAGGVTAQLNGLPTAYEALTLWFDSQHEHLTRHRWIQPRRQQRYT